MDSSRDIRIRGARQHNLQNISLDIPRDRLVVVTGLSGSGKSSLAFDTIHAEGRRKFMETLSPHVRQFFEQIAKPDLDHIDGLPPTIAIEQRAGASNPRSTVATITEVHDYLRLLFARAGDPHCWECGRPIRRQEPSQIVDAVLLLPEGSRALVLAPVARRRKGPLRELLSRIERQGFVRVRVNGTIHDLRELEALSARRRYDLEVVVDRLVVGRDSASRLAESLSLALRLADGLVTVAVQDAAGGWSDTHYSSRFVCAAHPEVTVPEPTPALFSFNSPHGACPACDGLGHVQEFDPDLVVPDPSLSLADGAIEAWRHAGKRMNLLYRRLLDAFCLEFHVPPDVPCRDLPAGLQRILLHGTSEQDRQQWGATFEGVLPNLKRRWESTESESVKQRLHAFMSERPCEVCGGARLRKEALAVKVGGCGPHEVAAMTIEQARAFLAGLRFEGERESIAGPILRELDQRLGFMVDVGVGYIALNRTGASLSGGEAQRIRLATQVGSGLVGVCYVLDEPTIGLHQRDSGQLIRTLRRLTDAGNTVILVEHDEDTIRAADHIIDMGPGAGAQGGRVVAQGTLQELLRHPESLTARYLRGEAGIPVPARRRELVTARSVEVKGAAENNLKSIDVRIPLGGLICVTGVSGSGKSTLVNEVLLKALRRQIHGARPRPGRHERIIGAGRIDKVIDIDQSPIGRSPRSNPCTYTGAFDDIRRLFAGTREARIRGYGAGRFSFNVPGGRCEACRGQGVKRIEMHFLPDVYVVCDVCRGTRYNRETLEVRYRGRSIADVLAMRVEEAIGLFSAFDGIRTPMLALHDVGLGYLALGQPSTMLSGGEAQRVKLAAELARPAAGHTLYVLDEPTCGLHFADVENLLRVLGRLVDRGHTVLVIEHNLEVIKCADWIIDLGPEGGGRGGEVVVAGRPEDVAAHPNSWTGRYLRERLGPAKDASAEGP